MIITVDKSILRIIPCFYVIALTMDVTVRDSEGMQDIISQY
ncbi:MAG TPA: hypothetical protein PLO88_01175 [Bacilli bacterium]|nr:hypothetical protein [Bacilli bacterium]